MAYLISKYRLCLMGFSIIWIILYHAPFQINNYIVTTILNRGYLGVDIFLFLSGFGLYYSYLKNKSLKAFYKKRLIRIFPEFVFVVLISAILSKEPLTIKKLIIEWSTLGYWIKDLPFYAWYISLIFLLYLIFPIFMCFFKTETIKTYIITICLSVIGCTITYLFFDKTRLIDFFSHLPIFFTGTLIAQYSNICEPPKLSLSRFAFYSIGIVCICSVATHLGNNFLHNYREIWNPYICCLFSLGIIGLIITMGEVLETTRNGTLLISFFNFFGQYSLELYIIHGEGYYNNITLFENYGISRNLVTLTFTILCIFMAWLLQKMNQSVFYIKFSH